VKALILKAVGEIADCADVAIVPMCGLDR